MANTKLRKKARKKIVNKTDRDFSSLLRVCLSMEETCLTGTKSCVQKRSVCHGLHEVDFYYISKWPLLDTAFDTASTTGCDVGGGKV